jgi:hypothetical protein
VVEDQLPHAPILDRLRFTSIDLSAILESYGFSAVPPWFWHPYLGRQPGRRWPLFTNPTSVAGITCARPPWFWHPYFGRQPGRRWPLFTKPTLVAGTTIAWRGWTCGSFLVDQIDLA